MTIREVVQFVREVQVEFSKVLWPGTQEFIGSVFVVLVVVSCFMVYLGSIDFVFSQLVRQVFVRSLGAAV